MMSADPTEIVPRRIREHRIKANWTLDQLADQTGLSQGHLSKLERGLQVPGVGTLRLLAQAFGIEVVDLVIDPAKSTRHAAIAATAAMTKTELRAIADGAPHRTRPRLGAGRGKLGSRS